MAHEKDGLWLELHRLSDALDVAGLTRAERLRFAMAEFERMPPMVRREMLRELRSVAADLLDLEPLIIAAFSESEQRSPVPQRSAS
jgi:hypothetical protein